LNILLRPSPGGPDFGTATTVVAVDGITKTYKSGQVRALDGITFSIKHGEIFGLIGPNGAGKTTLIGCLLALLKPDSGTVKIFGKPVDCLTVRAVTGYLPERADFEHWMSARQFLEYHYGLSGLDRNLRESAIDEALDLVELPKNVWHRRLKTYSRGMLQRLNLAQAVIGRPRLMLLDEPTLGLDPTGVAVVRRVVATMRETGVTAIINSHQLDEVERLCDRVAFIKQGKIAAMEDMHGIGQDFYPLSVRWPQQSFNGTLESIVHNAADICSALVVECRPDYGKFTVKDGASASTLLKNLMDRGIPVEEAVREKTRLEKLFVESNESIRSESMRSESIHSESIRSENIGSENIRGETIRSENIRSENMQ
jgi:ABC-2 type transport system ATP-binding protein